MHCCWKTLTGLLHRWRTVLESSHPAWKVGDAFVHNGWGVGETHWGCLAEKARGRVVAKTGR